MSHRLLVVVGGILAVFVLINCVSPTSAHINPWWNYIKIDSSLASHGAEGGAANLELAKQMLESGKCWLKSLLSPYQRTLIRIVSLEKILAEPTCDYKEYRKLKKIAYYTGGYKYVEIPETLRPIEEIVHYVAYSRAQKCRNKHLANFNEAYGKFDATTKERVEFMRDVLERPEDVNLQDYVKFLEAYEPSEEVEWNQILHVSVDLLRQMSPHDRDGCNFDRMFRTYMELPCAKYKKILGRTILLPAYYDYRMFGGHVSYTDEEIPLFKAMAHARVCEQVDSGTFKRSACANWLQQKPDNCATVSDCVH